MKGIGVIGLGSIGRRMLAAVEHHRGFAVRAAWDPDAGACRRAEAGHPGLPCVDSARAVLGAPGVEVVYIACPPRGHRDLALAAAAAGKAVFCEKPLGVDLDESRDLAARIGAAGVANAVNFVHAAAPAAERLAAALAEGRAGRVLGARIALHLPDWARRRYAEAPWLALRDQGGFTREVLSHFVFLCHRLFGPSRVVVAEARFPDDGLSAETALAARIVCGAVAVDIAGRTDGAAPDRMAFTLYGARRSYRVEDLFRLASSDGGPWSSCLDAGPDPALEARLRQLDALAAMLDARPSPLPSFRAALGVQEVIEALRGSAA